MSEYRECKHVLRRFITKDGTRWVRCLDCGCSTTWANATHLHPASTIVSGIDGATKREWRNARDGGLYAGDTDA